MSKFKLGLSKKNTSFEAWNEEVDKVLRYATGLDSGSLGGWPAIDAYEAGKSVRMGAAKCLKAQDGCPMEIINQIKDMQT